MGGRVSWSLGTPVAGLFLCSRWACSRLSVVLSPALYLPTTRTKVTGGGAVLSALIPLPESEKSSPRHCRKPVLSVVYIRGSISV